MDRPGFDYNSFDMEPSIAGFAPCQSKCVSEKRCVAWTFVKSGVQGPKAKCYLKEKKPKKVANKCCVSGTVDAHGCKIGGQMRMDILDIDCKEAQTTGCIKRLLTPVQYTNCLAAQKPAGGGGTTTGGGGGKTTTGAPVMTDLLNAHNAKRALHCTAPLQWDQTLADAALAWAKKCTKTHESVDPNPVNANPGQWGENLMAFGPVGGKSNADALQDSWYCEIQWYDFNNPKWVGGSKNGCDPPVNGHFTQLVWKNTTRVGCAKTQCGSQDYWVCKYAPPGNFNVNDGKSLKANVAPLCK